MPRQRRTAKRSASLPMILMGVTSLGMLGLVGLLAAWVAGYFESGPEQAPVDRTGQLAFPALSRDVPAFERLTRDDFLNPQTRRINVVWAPESVAELASRDLRDLIGRVLSRDKKVSAVLTERDLMERGTRPGLAAGIPAGKFAFSIETSGVHGLNQLRYGDRFDLVVALPQPSGDRPRVSNVEPAALFGGVKPPSLRVGQLSRQHGVKHLVTGGLLVQLFRGEKRSTTGPSTLTVRPGNRNNSNNTTAMFAEIAIDGEEIGALTEAISLGTQLTCVMRSGTPEEETGEFSTAGLVPVITTSREVAAFGALSEQNLIDEATGQLHYYYFPSDSISDDWITDPTQLVGRVVTRAMRRGSLLTKADLLPPGARPGITAGLNPGMAAMSIAKEQIQGFDKLSVGDSFSILTRVPTDIVSTTPITDWASLQGGRLPEEDARIAEMVRTGIREVVHKAKYLSESNPGEVVISLPDAEVAKLAQLLRDESEVFAVAHASEEQQATWQPGSSAQANPFQTHQSRKPAIRGEHTSANVQLVSQANDLAFGDGDAGSVTVPILVRDVPAFRPLSIDDFLDPATGRVHVRVFDADVVRQDWQRDVLTLIDRVTLRSLSAGRPVLSTQLAPVGTPPGFAVGLRPNERGVVVNSLQVLGLEAVGEGMVFDVTFARGVEVASLGDSVRQVILSADAVREAAKLPTGRIPVTRAVASGARLLADLGESTVTIEVAGDLTQQQTQTRLNEDGSVVTETSTLAPAQRIAQPVRRYFLAVAETEAAALLGSLDLQSPLQVALLPLEDQNQEIKRSSKPGNRPAPVRAIVCEHIRGNELETEVFLTDRVVEVE